MSILDLVAEPGRIVEGDIWFKGESLRSKSRREMRDIRGDQISMIFQQPNASLNPVFTAGFQIAEVFEIHEDMKRKLGLQRAVEMLQQVGIPDSLRPSPGLPRTSCRAGWRSG